MTQKNKEVKKKFDWDYLVLILIYTISYLIGDLKFAWMMGFLGIIAIGVWKK